MLTASLSPAMCIALLALGLLTVPLASDAQPLASDPSSGLNAFRQGLRDLGYLEGQNIRLEYCYAEGQLDRLPALAADLVRLSPNVIFTWLTAGALAAQQATTTIPIVVGAATDLVAQGIVTSLARPGGNLTGLALPSTVLEGKRLEVLKEAVPQLTRVAVLVHPADPAHHPLPVDKILKGAKPDELPIELPIKYDLVINLKTAKELGLTIPPFLLFQATEVIR